MEHDPTIGLAAETSGRTASLGAWARRVPFRAISQWVALAAALAAGWHGYQLVDNNRLAIDEAAAWYALALLLITYFAWDGRAPAVRTWPSRSVGYLREHPVELGLLLVVIAAGVATRLYQYGTLPPDGYVTVEEHINGGVAWDILQGDRPYIYAIPRYLNALSIWAFGPGTTGLRAHSVIAGILTIPFFYLMMRELVARPAALFATAIFASARVMGDVTVHYQTLILAEVVMIWLLLRSLNTGNLMWLVPGAALAVLLSYEYETAKALPIFVVPFLVWLALRALAWPIPRSIKSFGERIRRGAPSIAKGAIVVIAVVLIGLGPMRAEFNRGRDIYFGSLDRNQADRGGGRFAPDWEGQLESSITVFTPWVDPSFNVIGSVAADGAVDKATSILLWAGVASGLVFFWRGHRALFIGWFIGGLIMSSLLLSNWAPWKMMGWLPPAIALIGLLVDDLFHVSKRFGERAFRGVAVAFAVVAALVFALNMRSIETNASNPYVLKEWGNNPSYLFAICDNLNKRPDDTFGIVSQRQRYAWGFGNDVVTLEDAKKMWGDFRFVCEGQVGMPVANLQEVWPIVVTEDRPYTLIQAAAPGEGDQIANALERALPEIGEPDERKNSPGDTFELMIYDATREELNARRGLMLQWLDASGAPIGEPAISAAFDETPPAGATQYRITGLVSVAEQFNGYLGPVDPDPGVTITVEEQPSYAAGTGITSTIVAGWHLVEIGGSAEAGIPARFAWSAADGSIYDVQPDTMFALADLGVWIHLRELQVTGEGLPFVVLRYDFEPHITAIGGIRIDATSPAPAGATLLRDYYRGYWTLDEADRFTFQSSTGDQSIEMKIDGETVFYRTPTEGISHGTAQLGPGEHLIEITFSEPIGAYSGGFVWATSTTTGQVVPMDVRPFPAGQP